MTRAAPTVPAAPMAGLTHFRWTGLLVAGVSITLLFALLYWTAKRSVLEEIRRSAMGVATAVAVAIEPSDVFRIAAERNAESLVYRRLQRFLTRLSETNPDLRYAYIMTRAGGAFGDRWKMEFLVDQEPRDVNGNGTIERDEVSEPIGALYAPPPERRAALIRAWDAPSADDRVSPDPPYPDLLSGYAPIRQGDKTLAIVGADVTAATVSRKLAALKTVMAVAWIIVVAVAFLFTQLHYQQVDAFEQMKKRADAEATSLAIARIAAVELAAALRGGGGVAGAPPNRAERTLYDRFDLGFAALGDGLSGALDADDDHVFFHAGWAATPGIAFALAAGMLRLCRESCSVEGEGGAATPFYMDLLQPAGVLSGISQVIFDELRGDELRDDEGIRLVCGIVEPSDGRVTYASAGFGPPVRYDVANHACEVWSHSPGPPLGAGQHPEYAPATRSLASGDRLVWYSPDLLDTPNGGGELFGIERLRRIIEADGGKPALDLIAKIRDAVRDFAGPETEDKGFTLLVVSMR
jgi:hypothetical protein